MPDADLLHRPSTKEGESCRSSDVQEFTICSAPHACSWPLTAGLFAFPVAAAPAIAQEEPAAEQDSTDTHRTFCLNGAPRAECGGFLITEIGASTRIVSNLASDSKTSLSWELGAMWNVTNRHSLGAALYFRDLDADEARAGIRGRYRYWLDHRWSAELGAGVIIEANDVGATSAFESDRILGFSGLARMSFRDYIGVGLEVESIDIRGLRRQTDWFAAARVGSRPGRIGMVALVIITVIAIAAVGAG